MPHEGGRTSQLAIIAVLTNLPDSGSAFNLARELVSLRLAACANVLAPVTSFYRWEGRDEEATEYPVLIKSTHARYAELEREVAVHAGGVACRAGGHRAPARQPPP
jgi:periplasmic divalent cation tolerance protein